MDSSQLFATQIAIMVGSGLSFLGSLAMMTHILYKFPWLKEASSSQQQLFLFAFISFLSSPAMYINRVVVSNPSMCQAQGFFIQFAVLALPILCFCISLNFYFMLTNRAEKWREGHWVISTSVALGLGIPLLLAIVTYAQNAYGNALIWCWIVKARNDLRMSMFYAPLWIIIFMGIVLNLMTINHVYRVEQRIAKTSYKFTRNVSKVLLYGFVFVICWIPGTANRLHETARGSSPLWMVFLHCLGTTSLGFWTSVVYFILWFRKPKHHTIHSVTDNTTLYSSSSKV